MKSCIYFTRKIIIVDSDRANWEGEVKKFLNHGHFNSFIAMANALHLNMVIIPVDDCSPVMYMSPRKVTSRGTIFLVCSPHTQHCPQHYDAAVKGDEGETTHTSTQHQGFNSSTSTQRQAVICDVNNKTTGRKLCVFTTICREFLHKQIM